LLWLLLFVVIAVVVFGFLLTSKAAGFLSCVFLTDAHKGHALTHTLSPFKGPRCDSLHFVLVRAVWWCLSDSSLRVPLAPLLVFFFFSLPSCHSSPSSPSSFFHHVFPFPRGLFCSVQVPYHTPITFQLQCFPPSPPLHHTSCVNADIPSLPPSSFLPPSLLAFSTRSQYTHPCRRYIGRSPPSSSTRAVEGRQGGRAARGGL